MNGMMLKGGTDTLGTVRPELNFMRSEVSIHRSSHSGDAQGQREPKATPGLAQPGSSGAETGIQA